MNQNNESGVRFSDLVYLFVSKLWIMILVAVIVGGSLFAYNFITYEPQYKSTASMLVLRDSKDSDIDSYSVDVNAALKLVEDCKEILTTPRVLNEVIKENYLSYSYDQLKSMITVTSKENSSLLEIVVKTNDPQKSKTIVDSICAHGDIIIDEVYQCDQIQSVYEGTLDKTPINSRFSVVSVLIAIVAFILTYIVFVLIYIFDDRVSDPDLVERNLGLPVLALIPNMKSEKVKGKYYKDTIDRRRYYSNHTKGNK